VSFVIIRRNDVTERMVCKMIS